MNTIVDFKRRGPKKWAAILGFPLALALVGSLNAKEERCDPSRFSSDIRFFLSYDIHKRIAVRPDLPIPSGSEGTHIVRLCLATDKAGLVVGAGIECGEEPYRSLALEAVRQWQFRPIVEKGQSQGFGTWITLAWKESRAGLAEEVLSYSFNERDAEQLVEAIPKVRKALSWRHIPMILEVDRPPWKTGGFWHFHLWARRDRPIHTLGWYAVNAYSGEVWDTLTPEAGQIQLPAVKRLRAQMLKEKGLQENRLDFKGVSPWAAGCHLCRDVPCQSIREESPQ